MDSGAFGSETDRQHPAADLLSVRLVARAESSAPGLMFDSFLHMPDAESLPFYPLELKLVVRD